MKRFAPARLWAALPAETRPAVERLVLEAERRELGLHLVGGPVRDWLLGRPVRDVDLIAESERATEISRLARAALPRGTRIVSHARFGTARIELADGRIDLACARAETYAHPGALPTVRPGPLEEDLRRRDFTVNALAVPLTSVARRGRSAIVDPGRGRTDLEARTLRLFHAQSFHDDPTRALRAARLAPRLGFHLARGARGALRSALRDGAFGRVSGERFRAEIEKLFVDARLGVDPSRVLRALDEWHVLAALEPGLTLPPGGRLPLRRLGRGLAEGRAGDAIPWLAGLMLWLAPLDPALRRRALRRLALRGEPSRAVDAFARRRDRWLAALEDARGRGACDAVLAPLDATVRCALEASAGRSARRRIERWNAEDRDVRPPVGGSDLISLGLSGPAVGRALQRLRKAWLDREVTSRAELLALAAELAARTKRARSVTQRTKRAAGTRKGRSR